MYDRHFEMAVKRLLKLEGGHVNDPHDAGGETQFGISKRQFPQVDISGLTKDDAKAIYFVNWWRRYRYGEIDDLEVAAKVFDLSVNMGPGRAHRMLQRALNLAGERVSVDGMLGPETLFALNTHPVPEFVLALLKIEAVRYYASLENDRYERGWVRRAVN